ncbi:unnamed protein product [Paramecium pentaurelia]|uniref:Uncharacterized protein n=1 Tax=Paramecium pentaurelia TaxID=43138 RepID=A0A8S1UZI0_9CILI|nr:unnamed protein product [Paramecium pentaurelia]
MVQISSIGVNLKMVKEQINGIFCMKRNRCKKLQLSGGGSYDEAGDKNEKWIDISDVFLAITLVTCNGEYKNGKKIEYEKDKQNNKIGGGSYDEEGNGRKVGNWIVLNEAFDKRHQITYKDEQKMDKRQASGKHVKEKITYQNYQGVSILISMAKRFLEVESISCSFISQIFEFYSYGQIQQWQEGWHLKDLVQENETYKQIGGGSYDQEGQEIKIGDGLYWEKILRNRNKQPSLENMKIGKKLVNGIFGLNDMDKIHKIIKCNINNEQIIIVVGVHLITEVMKLKSVDGRYQMKSLVLSKKQPILVNIKLGKKWVNGIATFLMNGGGSYDENGNNNKIGQWIEQDFAFNNHNLILFKGEFQNGEKVGIWKVFLRDLNGKELNYMQQSLNKLHNFISCMGHLIKEEMVSKL